MKTMDTIEEYFKRQSKILKGLAPIIRKTGVQLIPAKKVKSRQIHPDDLERFFQKPHSKRKLRTLNYDQLQDRSESFDHSSMLDYSVDYYLILGYKVYRGGVGVAGTYTFADFVAEKDGQLVFGECLTGASLKKPGTLEKKMQLAQYGRLCFIIPSSAIKLDTTTKRLRAISRKHDVLVYSDVGFGSRENHLTKLDAYLFFLSSSRNLPRLSAQVGKKASLVTMTLQFSQLPESIHSVEVKETWRMAFTHHLLSKRKSFSIPVRRRHSNNEYLFNFEPTDFANSRYTKRDLLTIRIENDGVKLSFRSRWGRDVFKDRFVTLLRGKGIDREIKKFLSLAPTNT